MFKFKEMFGKNEKQAGNREARKQELLKQIEIWSKELEFLGDHVSELSTSGNHRSALSEKIRKAEAEIQVLDGKSTPRTAKPESSKKEIEKNLVNAQIQELEKNIAKLQQNMSAIFESDDLRDSSMPHSQYSAGERLLEKSQKELAKLQILKRNKGY